MFNNYMLLLAFVAHTLLHPMYNNNMLILAFVALGFIVHLLRIIVNYNPYHNKKQVLVTKPIVKNKFVEIRWEEILRCAELSVQFLFSVHPHVLDVFCVGVI